MEQLPCFKILNTTPRLLISLQNVAQVIKWMLCYQKYAYNKDATSCYALHIIIANAHVSKYAML